ncbi:hypothetical protein [Saliphagus infecundisoli]|uniref:Uncharacterized protein n=1 Tax=Saliphagus infecundisoli TaxID=1849069 RepID=A0ABD5QJZ7_9EURY|nr:hypothetical protein [Saliphagus infecundisoli]
MSSLVQQVIDFWGTRTAQAIGTVVVLSISAYTLVYDTGMYALISGIVTLAVGLLMLYDLLAE